MANKKTKMIYACQACGYQTPKWMGRCPECGKWHTLVEEAENPGTLASSSRQIGGMGAHPVPIDQVEVGDHERMLTRIDEFDRVLGGGLVPGTLVLIGGDPGIGKSTLMLQVLHSLAGQNHKVLYISGEESVQQIMLRSKRLDTMAKNLLVASEIDLDLIVKMVEKTKPGVLVIDSIQTMYNPELPSAPGSVGQVRESTMRLMIMAKKSGLPTFLIGHVTKDGAIAGPRVMEHMVDTVLYFEGDQNHVFRILRAVKNRFGSTNEIGVFEMKEKGLDEVANPSAVFLSERPANAPGSVVTACMEGTRPIMIELQALASSSSYGTPQRTILGLDRNRVALLVAVMEKKMGMHLMGHDIFMNVAGGVKVDEPAIDMGIVAAVASSFLDRPISEQTVVIGEVGLTGEVRAISQVDARIAEIEKLGFKRCLIPESNLKRMAKVKNLEISGIKTVGQAISILF